MNAEVLGVAAVAAIVGRCPHLRAFLDTNDRTPLTDGHIELYSEPKQTIRNRVGRVPVQVKSRSGKGLNAATASWSLTRDELQGFLQESGVLYFFVKVDPASGATAVYYLNLTPFKIADLLRQSEATRRSASITLTRFPTEPEDVERVLRMALKTREQRPGGGFDPVLLERAASLTLHSIGPIDLSVPTTLDLSSGDVAMSLVTQGGMEVLLGGVMEFRPGGYESHITELRVTAGGVTFDQIVARQLGPESLELHLGKCITVTLEELPGRRTVNISIRLAGSVADRIKAMDFIAGVLETGTMMADGNEFALGDTHDTLPGLDDARAHHAEVAELLNKLAIDLDVVDLDDVTRDQWNQLRVVRRAIVHNEEVDLPDARPGLVMQGIGEWKIVLALLAGSTDTRWRVADVFSDDFGNRLWARNESVESHFPVTPYDCVPPEVMPVALNMRLDNIVDAYVALQDWPKSTYRRANETTLALITASDQRNPQSAALLAAADRLNEWLISVEGPEPQHLINRWQIQHRRGGLNVEARRQVRELRRATGAPSSTEIAPFVEIACAILLDEHEEARFLVEALPADDRQRLESWPIWTLLTDRAAVQGHSSNTT